MIEKALKKLLLTMLKDEYPEIKGIVISSTDVGHGICLLYTSPSPRDRG